jgi:hypothetical protein
MNWYAQDVLIRQQLAEARRRAAHSWLLREARADREPSDLWSRLGRWLRRRATPGAVLVPQTKER